MDLTKIRKPFAELDQVTQWALKGAHADGETIQTSEPSEPERGWCTISHCNWNESRCYRLKPTPVIVRFPMGVSAYAGTPPLISEGHAKTPGWQHGITTVELTDGKATRITWEPSE